MQDGVSNVNELVEQRAAELKQQEEAAAGKQQDSGSASAAGDAEKDKGQQQQDQSGQQQQQQQADQGNQQQQQVQTTNQLEELLKEVGVKSVEELKEKLKPATPETPEQQKKRQEVYEAELRKYAIENDLMNLDDIKKYDGISKKENRDLVFEAFSEEVKDEIKEELGEDATEDMINEKIRESFENEYGINSANKKAQERGAAKLEKRAKEIRAPFESSLNTAKQKFEDEVLVRNLYPKYKDATVKLASSLIPENQEFFKDKDGEDEIEVSVPVSEDVKKKVLAKVTERIINSDKSFFLFKDGKIDDIKAAIEDDIDYWLQKELAAEGKKQLLAKGLSTGLKRGSNVGAQESFATKQTLGPDGKADSKTAEEQVIDSTRQKK